MFYFILVIFLTMFGYGQAQEGGQLTLPPASAPEKEEKKNEKILVTGSYIKRIDEEGPSAVVTINKEQLEKTGSNSVADVLRGMAVVTSVGRESSGSAAAGVATATLRGFGSDSILVLLNGLRLPKFSGGNSVDLNMIPISAIERIEILKDGASALYGSDAVGGVINFITKKDYNNTDVGLTYLLPEEKGGNRTDVVVSSGHSTDKYSIMGVLQYRHNERIYTRDRDYSRMKDVSQEGSKLGSPGTWQDLTTGLVTPATDCPAGNLIDNSPNGSYCGFDYTKYMTSLPELEQYSAMISGSYKFSDSLKVTTSHIYSHKDVTWIFAPAPDNFTVTAAQATAWGLPASNNVLVRYRLVEELGTRNQSNITDGITSQVALEGKFGAEWDWNLSGVYGRTSLEQTGTNGYANKAILKSLYGTTAFNPFNPSGSKSDISIAKVNPVQDIVNTQSSARFVTSGQLYSGGNFVGPIGLATGISADWETYNETVDAVTAGRGDDNLSLLFGGSGSNGKGRRDSHAAFTEFSIFPTDSLELQIAARYDRFNDFGDTVNPKISLSWQASEKFLLRTSMGTGFRAPDLGSLYGGESYGFPAFIDRKGCADGIANACGLAQYNVRSRGNANLKEETSVFFNLGAVAQPKKNWSMAVDGWMAVIKDQSGLSLTEVTIAEQRLGAAALQNQYGIIIDRDPQTGELNFIDSPALNLGESTIAGMDLSLQHQGQAQVFNKPIRIITGIDHTQFFPSSIELFPGNGTKKNRDITWKNTTYMTFGLSAHTLGVYARTITGGDKSDNEAQFQVTGVGSLPTFTQWDINYSYAKFFGGSITVTVFNFLDADRPLDDTNLPDDRLNTSVYDPIGRAIQASYRRTF